MKQKQILALGFFDGVHLGHQALLKACCDLAARQQCQAAVVTFDSHPDTLVFGKTPQLLNTADDRLRLLRHYSIGPVYTLNFDENMMTMAWQDFFNLLVEDYGAAGIVCGDDFHFGYRGEGNSYKLQAACEAQGFPCVVVPEQTVDGIRVSSTHIRSLLEAGQMKQAVKFLGHPHVFTGTVVSGRQLGRTIGVPTANLHLPQGVLVPKFGVYCCLAYVEGQAFPAVTNVGRRPTVQGHHMTVEPWLLNYSGDLYGKELTLAFYHFLRPEMKFPSLEALQAEIQKNAVQTVEFFGKM